MKGNQEPRITAATSQRALRILAQEEAEDLETKVRYKAPKQFANKHYDPYHDPTFWVEHSKKVGAQGSHKVARSIHDQYVNEIAALVEQSVLYIEVARHEEYQENGKTGEFDILARSTNNTYTYFEIKSSRHEDNVDTAYKQFMRAISAYPKRQWTFYLCTPLPNNEYLVEDFTEETFRRYRVKRDKKKTLREQT